MNVVRTDRLALGLVQSRKMNLCWVVHLDGLVPAVARDPQTKFHRRAMNQGAAPHIAKMAKIAFPIVRLEKPMPLFCVHLMHLPRQLLALAGGLPSGWRLIPCTSLRRPSRASAAGQDHQINCWPALAGSVLPQAECHHRPQGGVLELRAGAKITNPVVGHDKPMPCLFHNSVHPPRAPWLPVDPTRSCHVGHALCSPASHRTGAIHSPRANLASRAVLSSPLRGPVGASVAHPEQHEVHCRAALSSSVLSQAERDHRPNRGLFKLSLGAEKSPFPRFDEPTPFVANLEHRPSEPRLTVDSARNCAATQRVPFIDC
mmetsp:Transcript_107791/g.246935  ORF Transcript_107791/g.246935 Transcript_107791/m.246935 type:complete len:316 (+) Transcript_107791:2272-3219(+)